MNEETKNGTAKATARRRLIRGAFAAPTALTLYSGNVFAASSNLRALANQIADPKFPVPVKDPTDTWIRVRVYSVNGVKVVSGKDVALQPGCGSRLSFVGPNEWATVANPSRKINPGLDTPKETNKFAALRYDMNGIIVGVSTGDQVGGTTALTRSAGTSISVAGGCA